MSSPSACRTSRASKNPDSWDFYYCYFYSGRSSKLFVTLVLLSITWCWFLEVWWIFRQIFWQSFWWIFWRIFFWRLFLTFFWQSFFPIFDKFFHEYFTEFFDKFFDKFWFWTKYDSHRAQCLLVSRWQGAHPQRWPHAKSSPLSEYLGSSCHLNPLLWFSAAWQILHSFTYRH